MREIWKNIILSAVVLVILLLIPGYFYTEMNGFPWKRAQMKTEAVAYMKKKYNMDVVVEKSGFNFKFDNYFAFVYDRNDKEKSSIRVEKLPYHNSSGKYLGQQLEDNYSEIYWEQELKHEIEKKYPKFCSLKDIQKFNVDFASDQTSLKKGISKEKDKNGVIVPTRQDSRANMYVKLNTREFSQGVLEELLVLVKGIVRDDMKLDIFASGKEDDGDKGTRKNKTKLIDLEYSKLKDIHSIQDLRATIGEF